MTVDRFAADLRALGLPDGARLGVAVSGGPDSLALLLLAAEARPGLVAAATIDHQLRPEARAEAEHVATTCRDWGVPHDILPVTVDGSVQAGARKARYRALGEWCAQRGLAWIATGHHADDQAETLIMRISRGSGIGGLAGVRRMRWLGPGVCLIRPLLGWRKAELQAIVASAGLSPALDPSNADPAFDRTRARALLASADWLDPVRLAASATHLADGEAALAWATDRLASERIVGDALDPADLPPELLRRLMLRLFHQFGEAPRGPELTRLVATLSSGRAATLGGVKVTPGPRWTFAPAPPRRGDQ